MWFPRLVYRCQFTVILLLSYFCLASDCGLISSNSAWPDCFFPVIFSIPPVFDASMALAWCTQCLQQQITTFALHSTFTFKFSLLVLQSKCLSLRLSLYRHNAPCCLHYHSFCSNFSMLFYSYSSWAVCFYIYLYIFSHI